MSSEIDTTDNWVNRWGKYRESIAIIAEQTSRKVTIELRNAETSDFIMSFTGGYADSESQAYEVKKMWSNVNEHWSEKLDIYVYWNGSKLR